MQKIQTVCVIGSGVMGSAIAAQVANSETDVILLDIPRSLPEPSAGPMSKACALPGQDVKPLDLQPELCVGENSGRSVSGAIRNKIVKDAYDKLFTTKPPPLSHPVYAKYIQLGNLEDNLDLIKKADLIIEVIVEKLEIKHQLYEDIRPYLKNTAVLASNTSTLPLARLKEKLPNDIRSRFIITHFFNPPRYMELVELITSSETDKTIIPQISDFLRVKLGKTIVECNDTPGFIANRVGCFLLELVVRGAIKKGFAPQKIDHIFSTKLGFPSTGIFGLYDLIGHDVMDLISESLLKSLPKDDKYHKIYTKSRVLDEMRAAGLLGRKAGAGFYKIVKGQRGKSVKQVIDLGSARQDERGALGGGLMYQEVDTCVATDFAMEDVELFVSQTLQTFFSYVDSLIPSVTTKKEDIDKAMKLGYSLKDGPFELMEMLGAKGLEKSETINSPSITFDEGVELKDGSIVVLSNDSAYLRKANNHYIFAMKTKMNVLDTEVFNLMIRAVGYLEQKNEPLYIFPDGNNFSAGADLTYLKGLIESKNYKLIEKYLELGQGAMLTLKYAKIPIISCARGVALGGGAEILLHSRGVVAHQNLNAGLVELGVGLIPAFGGTKEMFLRSGGDQVKLIQNLMNILTQNKSSSAYYFAQDYNVTCAVSMHKDLLLELGVEFGERKRGVVRPNLKGWRCHAVNTKKENNEELDLSVFEGNSPEYCANSFDLLPLIAITNPGEIQLDIIKFFQSIVDKRTLSEQQLLDLEREKFLMLASKPLALERIKSITGS